MLCSSLDTGRLRCKCSSAVCPILCSSQPTMSPLTKRKTISREKPHLEPPWINRTCKTGTFRNEENRTLVCHPRTSYAHGHSERRGYVDSTRQLRSISTAPRPDGDFDAGACSRAAETVRQRTCRSVRLRYYCLMSSPHWGECCITLEEIEVTHSKMIQTRRRKAVGKKRRERADKLSKKLRGRDARPQSGPGHGAALAG